MVPGGQGPQEMNFFRVTPFFIADFGSGNFILLGGNKTLPDVQRLDLALFHPQVRQGARWRTKVQHSALRSNDLQRTCRGEATIMI